MAVQDYQVCCFCRTRRPLDEEYCKRCFSDDTRREIRRVALARSVRVKRSDMSRKELRMLRIRDIWSDMKQRCSNPKHHSYKWYGGRGIKVCERWSGPDGFANFMADIKPR